jgi:hypothetical protein
VKPRIELEAPSCKISTLEGCILSEESVEIKNLSCKGDDKKTLAFLNLALGLVKKYFKNY